MNMTRKINVNVSQTVKNAVGKNEDFHFYVDELASDDHMPTYAGFADGLKQPAFHKEEDHFTTRLGVRNGLLFYQAEIMNFLDNDPSENRMKFTKLQVACKYASIERSCVSH